MKKIYGLLSLLLLLNLQVNSADTTFLYGSNNKPVSDIDEAIIQKIVENKSKKKIIVKTLVLDKSVWLPESKEKFVISKPGQIVVKKMDAWIFNESYTRYYSVGKQGKFDFKDYKKGNLIRTGSANRLIPMELEDTIREYFPFDNLKSVALYRNNQLIANKNWLENGTPYINNIFRSADDYPEYSMGNQHFRHHLLKSLADAGIDLNAINDEILIGWVIMEDGTIDGVHCVSAKNKKLGGLMARIISDLPGEWVPAHIEGNAIRYYMELPFKFSLYEEHFDAIELSSGYLIYD